MSITVIVILCVIGWMVIGFFSVFIWKKLQRDLYTIKEMICASLGGLIMFFMAIYFLIDNYEYSIAIDFRHKDKKNG